MIPSINKTDTHKLLIGSTLVLPREQFIRQQLANFLASKSVRVKGYDGMEPTRGVPLSARSNTYYSVLSLPMIGGGIPDMDKGHLTCAVEKCVRRCLTIADSNAEIVGAIYFLIEFKTRFCEVLHVGVKKSHQNQQFGTTLLQSTLAIAKLYDCRYVHVNPAPSAMRFYKNQGFIGNTCVALYFDFQDNYSKEQFTKKAKVTAPHFDLQRFTDDVEAKRIEALRSFGQPLIRDMY